MAVMKIMSHVTGHRSRKISLMMVLALLATLALPVQAEEAKQATGQATQASQADKLLEITSVGRRTFARLEPSAAFTLKLTNHSQQPTTAVELVSRLDADETTRMTRLERIGPSQSIEVDLPVSTMLRPGDYTLHVQATTQMAGQDITVEMEMPWSLVHLDPQAMPVLMWQTGDLDQIAQIGFTHHLTTLSFAYYDGRRTPERMARSRDLLDRTLGKGLQACDLFAVNRHAGFVKEFPRRDRQGKPYPGNVEASNTQLQEKVSRFVQAAASSYGRHPALTMLLVNTEVRDHSQVSFGDYEPKQFKAFAGYDIPLAVKDRQAPRYDTLSDFPLSRVIDEDYPLHVFYRWWWKQGDGWNALHSRILRDFHQAASPDQPVTAFYDPAVRVPPLWGSGGDIDMIGQWTYSHPDPINIGGTTDELRAMAAGRPGQKLIKVTQAIWYRSGSAPANAKVDQPPDWVQAYPDAPYITCAPDILQEAFWVKNSRRLDAIGYHGYGSLVEVDHAKWNKYRFTNDQTRKVLARLIDTVVRPLGPVLMRVPERPIEVAILQSYETSLFASRGSWGWGWGYDAETHNALQWAGLEPGIIYSETILRDRLAGVKVLVLPRCEVLSRPVVQEILAFQQRGGIVVADDLLVPEILPDITVPRIKREGDGRSGKRMVQSYGQSLRQKILPLHKPYADRSDPDLIARVRTWKQADYLFVVNDRRAYGDYVGMYRKIMEKGLAHAGTAIVNRQDTQAVYNLVTSQPVPFEVRRGRTEIPVRFDTNDGRLFLLLPKAIAQVKLEHVKTASLDRPLVVQGSICDAQGQPIEAILPVEVRVTDEQSRPVAGGGFIAAEDGRFHVTITPSLNDRPGQWRIEVRELASGQHVESTVSMVSSYSGGT